MMLKFEQYIVNFELYVVAGKSSKIACRLDDVDTHFYVMQKLEKDIVSCFYMPRVTRALPF